MRQTLFRIPIDGPWSLGPLGDVPGFGFGIVLALWAIYGAVWLYGRRREAAAIGTLVVPAILWTAMAAAIVLLPRFVQRQADAAIASADARLAVDPRATDALQVRADARFSKRDYAQAVDDLRAAVAADPRLGAAYNRLAWIEATCPDARIRDGNEAVANAKKACALVSNENPRYLATLAAAQAETGEFAEAVATQRKALGQLPRADEDVMTGEIQRMRSQLDRYENGLPYRDATGGVSIPVFGFGTMLFIAFLAGAWTAARRGAPLGYSPQMLWDVGICLFIAGVIGCRAFYCIQYAHRIFYDQVGSRYVLKSVPQLVLAAVNLPDGGLVYYGGVVTGILAAIWLGRRYKLNLLELGDVVVPSVFLGMAFGRIGCFLNGCCYGDRCDLPWGVHFPMGSVPDIALVTRGFVGVDQDLVYRLHPTQLYSALDGLFLALLTHAYFRYRTRNGAVIALAMLTYPLTRFAIESLRGDELGQFHTSLTISQWVSIVLFAMGVAFTAWLSTRPRLAARPDASGTAR